MLPKDTLTQKIIDRLDHIDRKTLEKHLRSLSETAVVYQDILQAASEGVVLLDADGSIEWINAAALDLLGLPVNPAKLKKRWIVEVADPAAASYLKNALSSAAHQRTETFSVMAPRERRLRFCSFLVSGNPSRTAFIISDQTEIYRRSLERERMARLEDLMQLTAGIAHEIGNPLNALSIHMQLLKKEAVKANAKSGASFESRLSVMESEIKRLDSIIRNFLKATRHPPMRFQLYDFNDLIAEVVRVVQPEAEQLGVHIVFDEDKKMPVFLMDRARLYQALLNLIKNAFEAMPNGGRLKLQLTHRGRLAALRIEDNGCGMTEEQLPLIFNAFYTTKDSGTGLGLTSVLQSVSEHGGKIDVASKPGKGTTLTVYLPIRSPKLQLSKDTQ